MKTLIATALVALGLLSTAVVAAQADSDLDAYPGWAQEAFSNKG